MGIEPTFEAWEAPVLPLNYTRDGHNLTKAGPSGKHSPLSAPGKYRPVILAPISSGRDTVCMQTEVAEVLIDIEAQLRQLGLWDKIPPSTEALASTQPFCVDTLSLPQWLQFVFLPRLYEMLEAGQPLPDRCGIAPMAEEYFRGLDLTADALLRSLVEIDELLSAAGTA